MVVKTLDDSRVSKVELLCLLMDVLTATERDHVSRDAELELLSALELTADTLVRFSQAKRYALDGLPTELPADILDRHTRLLRLRMTGERVVQ